MNEPNTNENERTRTETGRYVENDQAEHLPLEGDPEHVEQSLLIGKTENPQEQTLPEQPQENPETQQTVVQDMSQCVAKTDIDN